MSLSRVMTWAGVMAVVSLAIAGPALVSLLPQVQGWAAAEPPQHYVAQTLYEYINGAAEAYLGYDFKEAVVGQFRTEASKATVTVDIYDMGTPLNAFGIYGAERSPESSFLPMGVQGYLEGEALNYFAGPYYVKLMCYDGGDKTGEILKAFARDTAAKVKDVGTWPDRLAVFPKEGRVPNSERFVLRSFLGYKFLSHAYAASYRINGREFEAVLIDAPTVDAAGRVLSDLSNQFSKNGQKVEALPSGVRIRDVYLKAMTFIQEGKVLCGVIKVQEEQAADAEKCLRAMRNALASK
jgi:hypothetical protein